MFPFELNFHIEKGRLIVDNLPSHLRLRGMGYSSPQVADLKPDIDCVDKRNAGQNLYGFSQRQCQRYRRASVRCSVTCRGYQIWKTAFEALQYGRLISLSPEQASTFLDVEKSLRPVEVRRELERLGHNADIARKRYSMLSTFSHVGGTGETLTMESIGSNVAFKIGGYIDPPLQKRLIVDCHKACGEFIAFTIGIRHENVDEYHRTIKGWIAEDLPQEEILCRIENLIQKMK